MNMKVARAVERLNAILPLVARQKTLSPETANAYLKVLRSYVERGRSLTRSEMAALVSDIDTTIDSLRSNDMVVFDSEDEPVGAYPFTMESRDHKVKVNGFIVHSMCALDALGISPMFGLQTHIDSVCAVTGEKVSIDQLDQQILSDTETSDVYFGLNWNAAANNCCATSLCTEMLFLKEKSVAHLWLDDDVENREIFTLAEAIDFSTRFFKPLVS